MKEIKAFVRRERDADIVHALAEAGFRHLSVVDAKGLLRALDGEAQRRSMEIGERVSDDVRLEVSCEDAQAERVVQLIRLYGRTGQSSSGWVCQIAAEHAWPIDARGG